jgi:hypothetical protein
MVSSLMPPHYALRMLNKHSHDSLHVKGWIREEKHVLCPLTLGHPCLSLGWTSVQEYLRETSPRGAPCWWHQRRHFPSWKKLCKTDYGVGPTNKFSVHCQYNWWVYPVSVHHTCSQCICWFEVPHAVTGQGGNATVAFWGVTTFATVYEQQQWGNSILIYHDHEVERTPGGGG